MDKNERKSMIKVRGGFSERIGKPTCAVTIQLDEFDDRTRTFISNLLFDFLQIQLESLFQDCGYIQILFYPSILLFLQLPNKKKLPTTLTLSAPRLTG